MRFGDIYYVSPQNLTPKGKMVLCGMTLDGPVRRPFLLGNEEKAEEILGNGDLYLQYQQARNTGIEKENIFIYRLNGRHGNVTIETNDGKALFLLRSIGANTKDRDVLFHTTPTQFIIEENGVKRQYEWKQYETVSDLVDEINEDASYGLVSVVAKDLRVFYLDTYIGPTRTYFFQDAETEESLLLTEESERVQHKLNYWEKFSQGVWGEGEFLSVLKETPCEAIVVTDMPFHWFPEIVEGYGRLANEKTKEQHILCLSFLSSDSWMKEEDGFEQTEKEMMDFSALFNKKRQTEGWTNHLHLLHGSYHWETNITHGAGAYGALYASGTPKETLTNRKIPSVYEIREKMTKTKVATLRSSGYICIVPSIRKGYVFDKSQSFSKIQSHQSYQDPSIVRALGEISFFLHETLDAYIGEPLFSGTKNVLEKKIASSLDEMVEKEWLAGYQLVVKESPSLEVILTLKFHGEIQGLQSSYQIKPQGQEVNTWITIL